ncbi:MAG: hypothetical protein ACKOOL_04630 [Novosphingobium sp.]
MADHKSEHRPIASLTPRLLARKGGAKPAMRPQASALAVSHEDLGWNDMGHDVGDYGQVVSLDAAREVPEVVRQQRGLTREVERRSALADGRRAAFTLRMDAERHLQLRLACTVKGRSAQQLVTEALDRLLAEQPELAGLAEQVTKSRT